MCLMNTRKGGVAVLYYALVFLVVGLIAGVLGATGVAAIASQIAWILFIIGVILLVIHLATGRVGPSFSCAGSCAGAPQPHCARGVVLRGRPRAGPPTIFHRSRLRILVVWCCGMCPTRR